MTDFARLVLVADSSQMTVAAKAIDQVGVSADRTEAKVESAAVGMSRAMTTVAASSKMAAMQQRNLVFQLNDVAVSLASGMNPLMVLAQQGSQIATIYGPEEGGVRRALSETGKMALTAAQGIGRFALAHPAAIAAAAAFGLGLRGMVNDLRAAGNETVSYGDLVIAIMQEIGSAIYTFVEPAVTAIGGWVGAALDWTAAQFKSWGNLIIQTALGTFEMVKAAVNSVPAAFVAAGGAAANGFIAAIEFMAREALVMVNGLIAKMNGILPDTMQLAFAPAPMDVQLARFDTSGAVESLKQQWLDLDATVSEIVATDYLGKFGDAIKARALANELKDVETAAGGAGRAVKAAADAAKDPWDGLRTAVKKSGETMSESFKFAKEVARGFFADLRQGLLSGENAWDALANAAANALDKIADKLFEMGSGNLFDWIFGLLGAIPGFGGPKLSGPFPAAPVMAAPARLASAAMPASGGRSSAVNLRIAMDRNGNLDAYVDERAASISKDVSVRIVREYDNTGKQRFGRDANESRKRGLSR
jgi:hypothetical protein